MKQFFRNKNNLIIGLFAIVILMGIGFAAYSQRLTITDTASSDSNWNVYIKSVTAGTPVGGASGSGEVEGKLTANLTTELKYPGDSITYTIVVVNAGNIDAILEEITLNQSNNDSVVKYSYAGIAKNDSLLKGEEKSFTVKVEYDSTKTGTATEAQKTNELTLNLDYVQKTSGGNTGGIADNFTGTLYSYNVLERSDYESEEEWLAVMINPGDSIEKIKGYSTEDYNSLASNFFLKHNMTNGVVDSSEVCFIKDGIHCLRPNEFETSKSSLLSIFGESEDVYDSYATWFADPYDYEVEVNSRGYVYAFESILICEVDPDGYAACYSR